MARFLPGCGGGDSGPDGLTTYVYLMMENRSFDHFIGARNLEGLAGDGLTNAKAMPDLNGTMIDWFPAGDDRNAAAATVCDPDPPHGWDAAHASFDGGMNDGFIKEHQTDHGGNTALIEPVKYLTRANLPITWALADQYTLCDRWFCSVMGPTLPNRAYWMTGTSFGINNNTDVLNSFSSVPVPTIFNRLEEAGVDWAYYFGSLSVVSLLGNPGPFQLDLGPNDGTGHIRRFGQDPALGIGQFFEDCAAGTLPPVVYIDPAFGANDDHPPVHPILGQELIASIYTALAKSPQWKNCMLVVTYDENGGYADHVAPPTSDDDTMDWFGVPGFEQLGFRVPTIVAGPYVKQNYISSTVYDHTSALKHLQNTFNLEGLTARQAAATDLSDCIDFDRLERNDPAAPIELPVIDSAEYPFDDSACVPEGSGFKVAVDPITQYANDNPGTWTAYADARDHVHGYMKGIRSFLESNGVRRPRRR